jgi:nitroreductase
LCNRRSQRKFNEKEVEESDLTSLYIFGDYAPTSCNRQGIYYVETRKTQLLSELLVGGKNWMGGADVAILFFADKKAYKAPGEFSFMPYLDTGHISQNMQLAAESMGLGSCFVNPNIRNENIETFNKEFLKKPDSLFCGCLAIGWYDKKMKEPKKREVEVIES